MEEAEAQVALVGIQELSKIYNGPITLEMDCSVVDREIREVGVCKMAFYAIVHDVKEDLKSFRSYEIFEIGRKGNTAAHLLAALARTSEDATLIGRGSECIRDTFQKDCQPVTE